MPVYYDLELLPVTVKHTSLPAFCTFSEDTYKFEPITHYGLHEVSGYLEDSLLQLLPFSFMVDVLNNPPFLKEKLIDISIIKGESAIILSLFQMIGKIRKSF